MTEGLKSALKTRAPLLSVGIVSADLMHLADAEAECAACGTMLFHFDVMDGGFCPRLTVGPFFVKGIATRHYKDVHLMVNDPLALIPDFAKAGADIITVHVESGRHVHRALRMIGEQKNANDPSRGILRGIALNPGTPVASIAPLIDETDIVCLLAVNPGFPGGFIESTVRRFGELKRLIAGMADPPLGCIDGGITADTIGKAAAAGPEIIVSGGAVFKNGAVRGNLDVLNRLMHEGSRRTAG
ncbi:MAG: ribulose-phosphate 3-epimerase [Chitinispirillaceae bacterium]|nr:ribulose-phosphate 3-epimerase [Chitinispirillaceae bacterium]